jgi:uncharacterized protein YqjF (DUF2071 family)
MNATIAPPSLQQRLVERTRPEGPVVMLQRWEQLLFLHWRYDVATVQAMLPPGLAVDVWDGAAWMGVVPLFMRDVRPRFVPAIPMLSDFLELNLRTYVYDGLGRPGIYFFSLDCDQPVAVETARRLLHLRYEHAEMKAEIDAEGWVNFQSRRDGAVLTDQFKYRGFGPAGEAFPESQEFFLLERYRLFATDAQGERMSSVRICHPPYVFRQAEVPQWSDAVLRHAKFETGGRAPDHICYVQSQEVEVFAPENVET